jgi:hypothetical protein
MAQVLVVGLPRKQDPEPQRLQWLGMTLTVVEPDPTEPMETISDEYLWVNYEEVIEQLAEKGDEEYAQFFRHLRQSPGGRQAPGLLIERALVEFI